MHGFEWSRMVRKACNSLEKPERFIWCVIRAKNHTHVFDIVLNGMHTHGLGLIQKVTHGFAEKPESFRMPCKNVSVGATMFQNTRQKFDLCWRL